MNIQASPDRIYAELFEQVQSQHLLGDSKSFVDAVARSDPADILNEFRASNDQPDFDLTKFVENNFDLPSTEMDTHSDPANLPIKERIEELWDLLTRAADERVEHSSLIPLPNPYVVPGGRFREVYYWDSYFTMLGLAESGRIDLIKDMVENFAYLIDKIGFIPNGNRTYYCSRSQPPFFALMVELLADVTGDDEVYRRFLPHLRREYAFWMAGAETLCATDPAHRRVVLAPGGLLNRYWDDETTPRQESYAEDVELAATVSREPAVLYRDIRAGAESGWDYSSRWFADRETMATIRTTQVIPVDLNCLMYNLENTLARTCQMVGQTKDSGFYEARAETRKRLLQTIFFDEPSGMFMDLVLPDFETTGTLSIAATYPLFFGIATDDQAEGVARCMEADFLKAGGWLTTPYETGQQWDRPNGWAPMQWIAYCGLERYGFQEEARAGGTRWLEDNVTVFKQHGRLLEKYNVESSGLAGTGGEYEVQDGFGWTNAVFLGLMRKLRS